MSKLEGVLSQSNWWADSIELIVIRPDAWIYTRNNSEIHIIFLDVVNLIMLGSTYIIANVHDVNTENSLIIILVLILKLITLFLDLLNFIDDFIFG